MEMTLKYEASASCSEDGDLAIESLFKPQRFVESLG
jgi:hypothetical protein